MRASVDQAGKLVAPLPPLDASRALLRRELACLPDALLALDPVVAPRPAIAPSIVRLAEAIDART